MLCLCLFILSGVSSPLISSSILGTYRPGEFIFQCPILLPFHTVLEVLLVFFSRQEYWSGLPFPSPVDHILSELSTMTHPSWVALHGTLFIFSGVISPLISSSILGNTGIECWSVQSLSHVWFFVTPQTSVHQTFLSFTISQSVLKFMSTESVVPSNHLILCRPLVLLLSIFPSIRAFSKELTLCIRRPKY